MVEGFRRELIAERLVRPDSGAWLIAAGGVDQNVNCAPRRDQGVGGRLTGVLIRHVGGQGHGGAAGRCDLVGNLLGDLFAPPQHSNLSPCSGQALAHDRSEHTRPTGHHRDLAGEVEHRQPARDRTSLLLAQAPQPSP